MEISLIKKDRLSCRKAPCSMGAGGQDKYFTPDLEFLAV